VNDLVNILLKNPGKKIVIKGYASSEGDLTVNRQLSAQRAASFKDFLVGKGIAADRISTEAKGIEDPAASNDTEDGRKKNRRVQITITD
jgi:outer membrane protein OmpA-like peptidoglycan-associated protein